MCRVQKLKRQPQSPPNAGAPVSHVLYRNGSGASREGASRIPAAPGPQCGPRLMPVQYEQSTRPGFYQPGHALNFK